MKSAVLASMVAAASATKLMPAASNAEVIPGSYIVTLKSGASVNSVLSKSVSNGVMEKISHVYSTVGGFSVSDCDKSTLQAIQDMDEVDFISPDQVMYALGSRQITDSGYWGLDRIDQTDLPLNSEYVFKDSAGAGVDSYVVDTGVRTTHNEFKNARFGAAFGSGPFFGGDDDCNGHGTHVGGTMGGQNAGAAEDTTIIAVKVLGCLGSGSLADVQAGIDYVAAQAQATGRPTVANLSLGGGANSALDQASNAAVAAGVHMVVAAGNDGRDACNNSPARASDVITVAASDVNDNLASFSSRGSCTHIIAPGVNVKSAVESNDNAYSTFSGTSMAAPHVAGAAALLLAESPSMAPLQMRSNLQNIASANKISGNLTPIGGSGSTPNLLLFNDRD
jgi:subtilisin family serine protease